MQLLDATTELEERLAHAGHVLLCLDFDGTLADIAEHPSQVAMPPGMRRAIGSLARRDNVSVAVISGRDRSDVLARVRVPCLFYAGNHGLDISGPGILFVEPTAAACSSAIRDMVEQLRSELRPISGAWVEDKGLTLSVHYRLVDRDQHEKVRQIVYSVLAAADQEFFLTEGRKVCEIRPPVHWNKGSAVGWIKEHLDRPDLLVIYLGDDITDEDAFAVLPQDITVKVGVPMETAAHYHVDSPAEVQEFLEWLSDRIH